MVRASRSSGHRSCIECGHVDVSVKQRGRACDSCRPERVKRLSRERRQRNHAKHRAWYHDWKRTRGCAVCDEHEPVCLDFHHHPGHPKSDLPSSVILHRGDREAFLAEIASCLLLCANCHRKVEHGVIVVPGWERTGTTRRPRGRPRLAA